MSKHIVPHYSFFILMAFLIVNSSSLQAQSDRISDFDQIRVYLITQMGSEYVAAEQRLLGAFSETFTPFLSEDETHDVIEKMRDNRDKAREVVARANANIEEALRASSEAAKHNAKYEEVDDFLSLMATTYSIYENANAIYTSWTAEHGNDFSLSRYLQEANDKNLLVDPDLLTPPDKDLQEETVSESDVFDSADDAYRALVLKLDESGEDLPDHIGMISQVVEDARWLENNSEPDWSEDPTFELTEAEQRIQRSLEILNTLDGFGPTYAEVFEKEARYSEWDFSKDSVTVLKDLLKGGGTQMAQVLKIIAKPTPTSDGTIFSQNFRNVYRDKITRVSREYFLWRTRKPTFSIDDLKSLSLDEIKDKLDCVDGCIVAPN